MDNGRAGSAAEGQANQRPLGILVVARIAVHKPWGCWARGSVKKSRAAIPRRNPPEVIGRCSDQDLTGSGNTPEAVETMPREWQFWLSNWHWAAAILGLPFAGGVYFGTTEVEGVDLSLPSLCEGG